MFPFFHCWGFKAALLLLIGVWDMLRAVGGKCGETSYEQGDMCRWLKDVLLRGRLGSSVVAYRKQTTPYNPKTDTLCCLQQHEAVEAA